MKATARIRLTDPRRRVDWMMRFCIIGCGRVGLTLAAILRRRHTLVGIYDADRRIQGRARHRLALRNTPAYEQMIRDSQAVLFTTTDDTIRAAFDRARPHFASGACVIHCSGSLPAAVFPRSAAYVRASAHPYATFAAPLVRPARRIPLFVEGDRHALPVVRRLFSGGAFRHYRIAARDKPLYHLSAVFASNLTIALQLQTYQLCRRLGWGERYYRDVVLPLAEETLTNIAAYGIERALTGPVRRGDLVTISRHLRILRATPALRDSYRALSRALVELAPRRIRAQVRALFR